MLTSRRPNIPPAPVRKLIETLDITLHGLCRSSAGQSDGGKIESRELHICN